MISDLAGSSARRYRPKRRGRPVFVGVIALVDLFFLLLFFILMASSLVRISGIKVQAFWQLFPVSRKELMVGDISFFLFFVYGIQIHHNTTFVHIRQFIVNRIPEELEIIGNI